MKKNNDTSFLARVILFFRAIKDKFASLNLFHRIKERQRTLSSYTGKEGSEESRISYGLGIAKVVCAACLALLLVVTVIFGSGVISYEKVYYMFKDISYIKSFDEGMPESLSYSRPVQNQVFEEYKNGLLVASDSEIKIFTSTGRVTLTRGTEMVNPRVSSTSGNVLVYDQGRKSFSIYNSFVKLYSERTEYPIAIADMAESGEFLIVTSSARYSSVVKIYGGDFKQQSEYSKNDRIISASISDNGKYAAIMSLDASDGTAHVTLNVLDCKGDEIISTTTLSGSMPYNCEFLTNERIALFLDDKVCIVSRDGKSIGEYVYPSSLEKIDVHGDRFALLLEEGAIVVLDSACSKVFSASVESGVRDVELSDGYIYLLRSREAVRISTALGTRSASQVSVDTSHLVAFDDGRVVACSQSAGFYISFD